MTDNATTSARAPVPDGRHGIPCLLWSRYWETAAPAGAPANR